MPLKINPVTGELDLVMAPGHGIATVQIDGDGGSATPNAAGVITIAGGVDISTLALGNTLTVNFASPLSVSSGGTGHTTLTEGAFLLGDTTDPVRLIGPLSDGQILVGDTAGVSPVAATITAGGGIDIVNGAGSITIAVDAPVAVTYGGTGHTTLTEHGVMLGEGVNDINITAELADGQLLIGSTGNDPVLATITAGEAVNVTNAAGSITIACEDATSANKGVASFDEYDFVVTAGDVALRAGSGIYFVGKWGNDAADGLTFESAKLTIQAAVTAAPALSTILVYPGTYTETVTHTASNITLIGQGKPNSVILTQADANVVNFSTYTGIQYKYFGITCTAATTAINTVEGTSGSCTFKECQLGMTSAAAIVAASQPAVGAVTSGHLTMRIGQVTYAHTGACGGTAQKGAFTVGDGGVVELGLIKNLDISNSGTALVSTVGLDTSSTGYFDLYENAITVTDPNATLVVGLGYLGGTGTSHEFRRNTIHITATANAGYGIFAADAASKTRSFYNHIHVIDTGGSSYGFYVAASAELISQFDDIVAADGNNIAGTLTQVNSEIDGYLSVTNTAYATTFDTNVAAAALTMAGTTIAADGTDANIPVTITPKGSEAVTIDGIDYPMADGTAGQCLVTDGSAVLSFGDLSVAAGGTGTTSNTAYAVLCGGTTATGAIQSIASVGTADQVLTSNGAGALPTFQDAGGGGGGLTYEEITDATKSAAINYAYVINRAAGVTVTLPDTAAAGSIIQIIGKDGLWTLAQNAGETVYFGNQSTTAGVGGSLAATHLGDCIELFCITANVGWRVRNNEGNISVT